MSVQKSQSTKPVDKSRQFIDEMENSVVEKNETNAAIIKELGNSIIEKKFLLKRLNKSGIFSEEISASDLVVQSMEEFCMIYGYRSKMKNDLRKKYKSFLNKKF